jgi:hypothetical protein
MLVQGQAFSVIVNYRGQRAKIFAFVAAITLFCELVEFLENFVLGPVSAYSHYHPKHIFIGQALKQFRLLSEISVIEINQLFQVALNRPPGQFFRGERPVLWCGHFGFHGQEYTCHAD